MADPDTGSEILDGLKGAVPVAAGYFCVATAFGLLVRTAGFSLAGGQGFSFFVFAGASQFAAVSMLGDGIPAAVIIITVLVMNLRHFLMSAALAPRLELCPRILVPLIAFGVTDETFAVSSLRKGPLTRGFLLTLHTLSWAGWNLGTLTGYLAGGILPRSLMEAMTLGLYLLFVALLVPSLRNNLRGAVLALSAAVLHSGIRVLFPAFSSWGFLVAVLAVCAVGAFWPERETGE